MSQIISSSALQNTEVYSSPLSKAKVLQLDVQGTPQAWISIEQAAGYAARDHIAWSLGQAPIAVLRGGYNAERARQSVLEIAPIIALRGSSRINLFDVVPMLTRAKLARRDRFTCAYCAQVFAERFLQCEHIVPASRGGPWTWMNLVTACGACNLRKAARTPEEAKMPLQYLPYVPSRFEDFLLEGRNIRADVHQWLSARLPAGSRVRN
jgi:HNH endonuclease